MTRRGAIRKLLSASKNGCLVLALPAGKVIYFVTRAKILEEAASIGNQANCSRFCANPAIAIITAHTKFALAEERKCLREKETVSSASAAGHTRAGGRAWDERRGEKV